MSILLDFIENPALATPMPVKEKIPELTNISQTPAVDTRKKELEPSLAQKKKTAVRTNEFVFRILSTWGHPHVVGLTEIELFDKQGKKVNAMITARNMGPGPIQPTSKLFNGKIYLNEDRYMWVAYLPIPPKCIELTFSLPIEVSSLGGIAVWNYNKNSLDSVRGIRDAEVLFNGSRIWGGTIKRANGRTQEDYSTEIRLNKYSGPLIDKPKPEEGIEMPTNLLKIKEEIETTSERPISVPIWLQGHQFQPKERHKDISLTSNETEDTKVDPRDSVTSIKKFGGSKRSKMIFSDRPPMVQHKNMSSQEIDQSVPKRGRKHIQLEQQREQSFEMHVDSLVYFESSKAQRRLKEMINPIPSLPKEINIKRVEEKDILDDFIAKHERDAVSKPVIIDEYSRLTELYKKSSDFKMPELPKGKVLKFDILSTWNDQYYVGLAGIEVFTEEGLQLNIHSSQIKAEPKDINVLPEYGDDPRTVDKLVDGVCFTRDDLHVWLAPYTSGKRHYVEINLGLLTTIAMIRIWNYNKSRVHTDRGVKDLIISLDERNIFMGEIRRSPGNLTDIEQSCEVLMFTSDPEIEHQIEEHDWIEKIELEDAIDTSAEERPSTASKKYTIEEMREMVVNVGDSLERPMTQAMTYVPQQNIKQQLAMKDKELAQLEKAEIGKKQTTSSVVGSQIIINILETWGDLFYVGLTGIAIYTDKDELVKLNIGNISASPSDLNSIPGYGGDYRTLDKLIDGVNVTTDDRHMWMIPFNKGLDHTIVIKFPRPIRLKCIRFYNYNKSVEDTFRGAKSLSVSVDGKLL